MKKNIKSFFIILITSFLFSCQAFLGPSPEDKNNSYKENEETTTTLFSPMDISGLKLWFAANDGVFNDNTCNTPANDGDDVLCWKNLAEDTSHPTASAVTAPKLKTSSGFFNNKQTIDFIDTTDTYLDGSGTSISNSDNNFTINSYTYTPISGSGSQNMIQFQDPDGTESDRFAQIIRGSGTDNYGYKIGAAYRDSTAYINNTPTISTIIFKKFPSSYIELIVNGTSIKTTTTEILTGFEFSGNYLFRIGSLRPGAAPYASFDGEIAEILVFNSALSTTDRQKAECYLTNKYQASTVPHDCATLIGN